MRSRLLVAGAVLALAAPAPAADPPKGETRAEVAPAPDAGTQIACVVRVLTVRDDTFERLGIDLNPTGVLSDGQLRYLLEAVQGDRHADVMQCPKVTTPDGQEAVVRITERRVFVTGLEATRVRGAVVMVPKHTPVETGTTLTLCGKVAADGKTVGVRVSYKDVRVEEPVELVPVTTRITPVFEGGAQGMPVPFTQYLQVPQVETLTAEKGDLAIPSGGHAVVAGPTRVWEERQEWGTPVLSKIPHVGRLFKNRGVERTTLRTYLVVSPLVLDAPPEPARR